MAATRIMLGSSSYGSIRWKPPLLHHRYSFRLSLPVVQPLSPAASVKFDRYRRRKSNIGGLTCLLSNPNSSSASSKEEESSSTKLLRVATLQAFAKTILKILKKTAISAALLLMGLLVVYNPNQALAASGGRMGGRSSSSSSSSSTRSYSTRKARPPEFSYPSVPYYAPYPFGSSGGGGFYVGPAFGVGPGSGSFLIFLSFTAFVVVSGFLSDRSEGSVLTDAEKTSILKLQVGLLGTGRSLQRDLNRIAETADTSTSEGLHYVLTETSLALLRHPSYCISAYSSVDVLRGMEEGEKRFNQLSIEERGKFDEETLVNVNNNMVKKKKMQQITTTTVEGGGQKDTTSGGGGGFSNEYIVITMLVAAEGGADKLPAINGSGDLKQGLEKLASIPATKTLAVEVLWTPQNEDDSLSETQLVQDYPLLRPL